MNLFIIAFIYSGSIRININWKLVDCQSTIGLEQTIAVELGNDEKEHHGKAF